MNIEKLSWVLRGKQRREIIKFMDKVQTPTEIAKRSRYSLNHTSRVLRDFVKKGIAKCLNPKEKTGRLYVLTKEGKEIRDKLIKK